MRQCPGVMSAPLDPFFDLSSELMATLDERGAVQQANPALLAALGGYLVARLNGSYENRQWLRGGSNRPLTRPGQS